uniref:(northern house mosquito) hypothetical protein n=1 Tax=Culex pipiens TaxID=7175 RepID=A0A8D8AR95_CULPI
MITARQGISIIVVPKRNLGTSVLDVDSEHRSTLFVCTVPHLQRRISWPCVCRSRSRILAWQEGIKSETPPTTTPPPAKVLRSRRLSLRSTKWFLRRPRPTRWRSSLVTVNVIKTTNNLISELAG